MEIVKERKYTTRRFIVVCVGALAVSPDADDYGEHGDRTEQSEAVYERGLVLCE